MRLDFIIFCLGVACFATVGFLCPIWYLGFLPLGAGSVWAAYFLIGADRGATRPAP